MHGKIYQSSLDDFFVSSLKYFQLGISGVNLQKHNYVVQQHKRLRLRPQIAIPQPGTNIFTDVEEQVFRRGFAA